MTDTVLTTLIVLLMVAVGGALLRLMVRAERQAQARHTMDLVYYVRRERRNDVPEWKRVDVE